MTPNQAQSPNINKIRIKRLKKRVKKATASEKVLTGFGLGAALLGGMGGAAKSSSSVNPPTQIVSTSQGNKTTAEKAAAEKIMAMLRDIFGIEKPKADNVGGYDYGLDYPAPGGGNSIT